MSKSPAYDQEQLHRIRQAGYQVEVRADCPDGRLRYRCTRTENGCLFGFYVVSPLDPEQVAWGLNHRPLSAEATHG